MKKALRKKGDRVYIRKDIIAEMEYASFNAVTNRYGYKWCYFVEEMEKYRGKTAIIESIYKREYGDIYYYINIDGRRWKWTDEMFEENVKK